MSNSIVEFSDFEHQKENIQPLRQGRSAQQLSQLYSKPTKAMVTDGLSLASHLHDQNSAYLTEIAKQDAEETDDPLDIYYRYVGWLLEVVPQSTGNRALIRVVEKPLKLFSNEERYRNDMRYLRLWIWYTGLLNEGRESVFQYMMANRVGDALAVMYETYAKELEAAGKWKKADEVWQLGVGRRAEPRGRLERRYGEFQKRLVMKGAEREEEKRGLTSEQQGGIEVESVQRTNGRISVFRDETEGAAVGGRAPWGELGSDEGRRKENIRETQSWKGQKMAQQAVAHEHGHTKFEVFKDTKRREERMVMAMELLFPEGTDAPPQCVEEARARLPQYRYKYVAAPASPTINTRMAQQDMLDIWNTQDSSDSEDEVAEEGDYQFTMGPVVPNVVPQSVSRQPAMIPPGSASASAARAMLRDEDPPTLVMDSIRQARRRREHVGMTPLTSRGKPVPLFGDRSGGVGTGGFTGLSTVGERTPLDRRLSMAARDLSHITPRFPQHTLTETETDETDEDDDDDDDDDEEGEDPVTEEMGAI